MFRGEGSVDLRRGLHHGENLSVPLPQVAGGGRLNFVLTYKHVGSKVLLKTMKMFIQNYLQFRLELRILIEIIMIYARTPNIEQKLFYFFMGDRIPNFGKINPEASVSNTGRLPDQKDKPL